MKVKDLVAHLQTLDQEKEIIAVSDYWMSSCNNLIPAILYEPVLFHTRMTITQVLG